MFWNIWLFHLIQVKFELFPLLIHTLYRWFQFFFTFFSWISHQFWANKIKDSFNLCVNIFIFILFIFIRLNRFMVVEITNLLSISFHCSQFLAKKKQSFCGKRKSFFFFLLKPCESLTTLFWNFDNQFAPSSTLKSYWRENTINFHADFHAIFSFFLSLNS